MLTTLHIRNFALIDSLTVELGPGLNVLTGETGAGKSIVVGALSLLLGVPLSWLHEHCAPNLSAAALAERLALTGTEVERVAHHGVPSADGFVIGHVLSVEPPSMSAIPNAPEASIPALSRAPSARTIPARRSVFRPFISPAPLLPR